MKTIRIIGVGIFVVALFIMVFIGIPWHIWQEPTIPLWLKIVTYCIIGGILVLLLTVAAERQKGSALGRELSQEEITQETTELKIPIQTATEIPGFEISENLGLVKGHTIFAIFLGRDMAAIMRMVLGGELIEYTEMMGKARKIAIDRMQAEALDIGADAIINVRFMTTSVVGTAAELLAYGTAVRLNNQNT
jgi:uncharacterized protein YbjQ (UPF0145 family)